MTAYIIDFEPVGRRGKCQSHESILSCARRLGIGISSVCGGKGRCHLCKVQILSGSVSAPISSELEALPPQELKEGWRLACQTYPRSNCKLHIPAESMTSPQRTQVEGLELEVPLEPPVKAYHLLLPEPSLSDLRADANRLLEMINQQAQLFCDRIDIDILRTFSPYLRAWEWDCQALVRENEVIAAFEFFASHALRRSKGMSI